MLKGGLEAPVTTVPERPTTEKTPCQNEDTPAALKIAPHVMSLIPTMPVVAILRSVWRPEQPPPVEMLIENVGST